MTLAKNLFGGANPNGLYVPLSEDEQEALNRLVERDDLELVVHGWGLLNKPFVRIGDKRLSVQFSLTFKTPLAIPVTHFDLELRTRSGMTVFREKKAVSVNGQPLTVHAGLQVALEWSINIHHVNPELVKILKPGAIGLTSRRLDKDTGLPTFKGNMKLTPQQEKVLRILEPQEAK